MRANARSATLAAVSSRAESRLRGVVTAALGKARALPPGNEDHPMQLTDLVPAAIANVQSRAELEALRAESRRSAEEHAALRRVATLVACGAPSERVFAAVTEEVGRLLGVDRTSMWRYELNGTVTEVMVWRARAEPPDTGKPLRLGGHNAATLVRETGRPVRIDSYSDATGPGAEFARARGFGSSVAAPIKVDGRVWGMMIALAKTEQPPADTEERLTQFTELVATAIANAEARAELTASRGRVIAAGDEARRRLERDLHDGVQQRLVSLSLELRRAQLAVPETLPDVRASLARAADALRDVVAEVQEISRGIHPAILSKGGLAPALRALGRRAAIPIEVSLQGDGRLPEHVEVAAYYVVAEAVANVIKHAHATAAVVSIGIERGALRIEVRDDGVGGADPRRGSGLLGLIDRIEALGGKIRITSPSGGGTTVHVTLPLDPGLKRRSGGGHLRVVRSCAGRP